MSWYLFLDDLRSPPTDDNSIRWVVARSSSAATAAVIERGCMPKYMALDHDLGGEDTTLVFLGELFDWWQQNGADPSTIPEYGTHTANPVGEARINSFMRSWAKTALCG